MREGGHGVCDGHECESYSALVDCILFVLIVLMIQTKKVSIYVPPVTGVESTLTATTTFWTTSSCCVPSLFVNPSHS